MKKKEEEEEKKRNDVAHEIIFFNLWSMIREQQINSEDTKGDLFFSLYNTFRFELALQLVAKA